MKSLLEFEIFVYRNYTNTGGIICSPSAFKKIKQFRTYKYITNENLALPLVGQLHIKGDPGDEVQIIDLYLDAECNDVNYIAFDHINQIDVSEYTEETESERWNKLK